MMLMMERKNERERKRKSNGGKRLVCRQTQADSLSLARSGLSSWQKQESHAWVSDKRISSAFFHGSGVCLQIVAQAGLVTTRTCFQAGG